MIEFKGEWSGECRKFVLRSDRNSQLIVCGIISVICTAIIICLAIFIHPMILLFLLALVAFMIIASLPPSEKTMRKFFPNRIFIDTNEETIVIQGEAFERFHMISAVSEVFDYGEWYDIKFVYSDRDQYFVCQKSLLSRGSLEEFEKIFEEKLVRKSVG